ncbi:MAG TPA: hypothetical protein IAA48_09050 [Candidatus Eubacterium faecipullorum]|uniref:Uncharacterized protein n=1 Tax=Candidatus Eubacterium faecipullorum TaxID=2838571 RepID=A0A9D1UHC4_9FIRM|nr:hypothetical protein [Candidatus Eubacterium faecipullorum]
MKLFIGILVVIAVIIVVCIVIVNKPQSRNQQTQVAEESSEFYKYYRSVNQMDCNQLKKIHDDLLPLCIRSNISGIVWYDDSIPYEKKRSSENKINKNVGELIPENERIYGCVTYSDARRLNQAIVKRLDELEE